jgi:hypothetical protein
VGVLVAALVLSVLVFAARVTEVLPKSSPMWRAWQALMAVIGIITVPQILWVTFTGSHSLLPGIISAVPGVPHPRHPCMHAARKVSSNFM